MSITISTELPIKSNEIITSIGQQSFIRTADNIRLEEYEINTGVIVKDVKTIDFLLLIGRPKKSNKEEILVTKDLVIPLYQTSLNFDKPLIILNNQFNVELFSTRDDNGFIPTTYKFLLSNNEFKIYDDLLYIWFTTQNVEQKGNNNVTFFRDEIIFSYQKLQATNTRGYTNNIAFSDPYDFVGKYEIQMRLSFTLFYMEKKIIW